MTSDEELPVVEAAPAPAQRKKKPSPQEVERFMQLFPGLRCYLLAETLLLQSEEDLGQYLEKYHSEDEKAE